MAALRHQTGSSPPRRTELVCTRGAVCDALIAGTLLASSQKVQDLLQDIDSKRRIRDSGMPSAQRIGWRPPPYEADAATAAARRAGAVDPRTTSSGSKSSSSLETR